MSPVDSPINPPVLSDSQPYWGGGFPDFVEASRRRWVLVERGRYYSVSVIEQLANGAVNNIRITTGRKTRVIAFFDATGNMIYRAYSDPVITGAGTVAQPVAFNLVSPAGTTLTAAHGVTVSSPGTFTGAAWLVGGGSGGNATGGAGSSQAEIILPPNQTFLVECTNIGGSNQYFGLRLNYYEYY